MIKSEQKKTLRRYIRGLNRFNITTWNMKQTKHILKAINELKAIIED